MDIQALNLISYGLYIVSSIKDDKFNGQIANVVFQVTSEPPTIAICINKKNLTWEYISAGKVFGVSILCQETPLTFIGQFGFKSGRDINKFENVKYITGETGAPLVLDNTTAVLEARVTGQLDVGTHTIFVGRLVGSEILNTKLCMTYEYYHQVKKGLTPKAAPSYVPPAKESNS